MKIIRDGDGYQRKEQAFKCPICGCIFVAGPWEYRLSSGRNELYAKADCPQCGTLTCARYDGGEKEGGRL